MADGWGFEPGSALRPRLHATSTGEAGHGDLLRLRQGQRHLGKDLLAGRLLHLSVLRPSALASSAPKVSPSTLRVLKVLGTCGGFFTAMEVLKVKRALARSLTSSKSLSEGSELLEWLSRISGEHIFIGKWMAHSSTRSPCGRSCGRTETLRECTPNLRACKPTPPPAPRMHIVYERGSSSERRPGHASRRRTKHAIGTCQWYEALRV